MKATPPPPSPCLRLQAAPLAPWAEWTPPSPGDVLSLSRGASALPHQEQPPLVTKSCLEEMTVPHPERCVVMRWPSSRLLGRVDSALARHPHVMMESNRLLERLFLLAYPCYAYNGLQSNMRPCSQERSQTPKHSVQEETSG